MSRTGLAAGIIFLMLPVCAQAQLHRCIDERGRSQYTDKPIPGCKPVANTGTAATPPASKPALSAKARRAAMSPEERERLYAECKTLQEQLDWLNSPRGAQINFHTERVGQITQAMARCP